MPHQKEVLKIAMVDAFEEFCQLYEEKDIKQAIKKAVKDFNNSKVLPPIQLENFLSQCSAKIEEKDLTTTGKLEIEDDCFKILVDKKLREEIKRFTIAHEIAHIIFINSLEDKPHHLQQLKNPSSWKVFERLCNYTASQILVPDEDFVESVKKFGLSTEGIEKIRTRYNVSYEVILRKFVEIFVPSAVILWKSRGTGLDQIAPRIARYPYSSIPHLHIEEGSIGTPRLRSVIKTAIKEGSAWVNSIKCEIEGEDHSIIAYAFPTSEKIHFNKIRTINTIERTYEEQEINYYDVLMFYLPTDLIYNSETLQIALGAK